MLCWRHGAAPARGISLSADALRKDRCSCRHRLIRRRHTTRHHSHPAKWSSALRPSTSHLPHSAQQRCSSISAIPAVSSRADEPLSLTLTRHRRIPAHPRMRQRRLLARNTRLLRSRRRSSRSDARQTTPTRLSHRWYRRSDRSLRVLLLAALYHHPQDQRQHARPQSVDFTAATASQVAAVPLGSGFSLTSFFVLIPAVGLTPCSPPLRCPPPH